MGANGELARVLTMREHACIGGKRDRQSLRERLLESTLLRTLNCTLALDLMCRDVEHLVVVQDRVAHVQGGRKVRALRLQ